MSSISFEHTSIISTLVQHDFGYPVGFGEVKPGNSSTTKSSVCLDVLRLGIASKRAIDKWHLDGCLAFMINGFYIPFFVVRKQHKHLYRMTEIGAMVCILPPYSPELNPNNFGPSWSIRSRGKNCWMWTDSFQEYQKLAIWLLTRISMIHPSVYLLSQWCLYLV